MMNETEHNARAAYIANSHFVSDNEDNMHINLCIAFGKEQDRLHVLIQKEEDARMEAMKQEV